MAVVGVRAIGKLDARVRASELPAAGYPGDGGAFIKQVNWAEVLHSLFHYQLHSQHLPLIVVGDELGG